MARGKAEQRAAAAHVLHRTSFGPFPGGVGAALDRHGDADSLLEATIAAAPVPLVTPANIDRPFDVNDKDLDNEELSNRWIERMCRDDVGLHDKMVWFWHTHFTSGFTKVAGLFCWRQLRTFHELALGNFGDLTKAITIDGAMLQWLDGSGSQQNEPNENYGRELLELFTMGRGNYTEADVRAAARGLAGWSVSNERGVERFDVSSLSDPVTFLGRTEVFDVDSVVDRILEIPATAEFIVAKLARYFVGTVSNDVVRTWADQFRSSGYELRPVVETILRSPEFRAARGGRGRSGIEWLCGVIRCAGLDPHQSWHIEDFAQIPYKPLNVAGWPDQWLSTSSLYARAAFVFGLDLQHAPLPTGGEDVDAVLEHCSLYEVSEPTRAALADVARRADGDRTHLLRAALISPEFAVA